MKKVFVLFIACFIGFTSAHAEGGPEFKDGITALITASFATNKPSEEILAELTKEGMSITDAVAAMIKVAPEKAASITAAAIKIAPAQAKAITKVALIAAPGQAAAINKASQSADPTANLGATASGPAPGVTAPKFSTPRSTPAGGGGVAASPA